jgi:hypothetical protein
MAVFVEIAGRLSTRKGEHSFDYLKDLFTRLPAAKITQLREFTPSAWANRQDPDCHLLSFCKCPVTTEIVVDQVGPRAIFALAK